MIKIRSVINGSFLFGATLLSAQLISAKSEIHRKSGVAARQYQELIPKTALGEAIKEIGKCTDTKTIPAICSGVWKGVKWQLVTQGWLAQIDMPNGLSWIGSCKFDPIESEERCSWATGDEFVFFRGTGYRVFFNWGYQKYPTSEMIGRFDESIPTRTTAETWTDAQSRLIFDRMMSSKIMRYRWYSWPDDAPHDGEIDLTGFADAAALMEGFRGHFIINHALKKID